MRNQTDPAPTAEATRTAKIAELEACRPDAEEIIAKVYAAIAPFTQEIHERKAAAVAVDAERGSEALFEWTHNGQPMALDYYLFWAVEVIRPAVAAALEGMAIYCVAEADGWQSLDFACDLLELRPYGGVSSHDAYGISHDLAFILKHVDHVIRQLVEDYDEQLADLIAGIVRVVIDDGDF